MFLNFHFPVYYWGLPMFISRFKKIKTPFKNLKNTLAYACKWAVLMMQDKI